MGLGRGQPRQADPAVPGHVDMVLVGHTLHLHAVRHISKSNAPLAAYKLISLPGEAG